MSVSPKIVPFRPWQRVHKPHLFGRLWSRRAVRITVRGAVGAGAVVVAWLFGLF